MAGMMIKTIANTFRFAGFFLAAAFGIHLQAQNLLPNPSFENLTPATPTTPCSMALPDGHFLSDWHRANTSDFIHTNYPISRRGDLQTVPYNGKGMVGLYMNDPARSGVSEYIFAKLSDTVRAGCTYRFEVAVRFKSLHFQGIDKLEIKLLHSDACEQYLPDVPGKIYVVPIDKKKASENEWMLLSMECKSDADYSWLAVGNFTHTGSYFKTNKKRGMPGAYIYIDDIALTVLPGCPEYKAPMKRPIPSHQNEFSPNLRQ